MLMGGSGVGGGPEDGWLDPPEQLQTTAAHAAVKYRGALRGLEAARQPPAAAVRDADTNIPCRRNSALL
jgi:hypothetical protein